MNGLSHTNPAGEVRMVDVSDKTPTTRMAVARGVLLLKEVHRDALDSLRKGDALVTAQIAGIQGGKRTADLIPLCHPIPLTKLDVQINRISSGLEILATAKTNASTGVEMEAYTAVVVAGITLIDMLKGVDPDLTLTDIQLQEKTGGKADWQRKKLGQE